MWILKNVYQIICTPVTLSSTCQYYASQAHFLFAQDKDLSKIQELTQKLQFSCKKKLPSNLPEPPAVQSSYLVNITKIRTMQRLHLCVF